MVILIQRLQRCWLSLRHRGGKCLGYGLILLSSVVVNIETLAADVEGVRLWRAPDNTRLVFDLSHPAEHKLFTLSSPSRLVIDIENTQLSASFNDLELENTPIARIRSAVRNKKNLRVVLDLKADIKPKSFALLKNADKPDRLVVDLYDDVKKSTVKTVATARADSGNQRRDILIAVDAGHGGEDPGASGPGRLREKDVVLAIAKELAKLIDAESGFKSNLVRTGDYYIPLYKRRDHARNARADLFVSVHADAFHKPQAKGASVFALSRKGASSETARFLAKNENKSDLIGGVGNVDLGSKSPDVQSVLVDLSMTATLSSSLEVGDKVLKSMGKVAKLHKSHVEQAGFAVLKSPDVPSILVETGFISNPGEAKKLSTPSYRRKLAKQIFSGIKSYFYDNPPSDSLVAWRKSKKGSGETVHVIASGDTLSKIAQRYNISVNTLRAHNGLRSDLIRVGQRIKIPTS
ncbi:N-acetylmuramoyl-L-alanine amidase [Marinibactrum halimedae]|uniref:N-acetylmuramoyl-L-alanine amidase AmiC n=1 Tax=Marinibactrum halimedae TaxID=1444977 RepID=A0AA37T1L8_9GAMM|nr:N-acetylmuramoyl-L-alanine amidase [Marinibactrum halimedae]MCD9459725.1 N-acetylmuramoyl-L-alanine amidase [Marinibactrum halimedae]GLS24518.1 N-acetylmuramoyl-L-alanine amidase [Marinibactrum halimedae]